MRRRLRASAVTVLCLLGACLLAACGKKGPPSPVGPSNQVTYPKTYPTH